jgi:NAD(P)-dependent dehydrogenase (short-subunit alcohol dehydrogenase family)
MQRYDNRVAVVTGASSGIGRRVALDLAARGATVLGLARREALLADLRPLLQRTSPRSDVFVCDVADDAALQARLAEIESVHGHLDVLVNNAGIDLPTPVGGAAPAGLDVFSAIMATNYFAVVAGTLAVLPGMLQRHEGVVVNVSSDSARAPEPRTGGYAASKAAVSAFTESVAHEIAGRGVHVHVLYPAWVPTAMGSGDGPLPPKLVRRTEAQVSTLLLEQAGGPRIDINAAWLPKLAVIGRTVVPRAYQRSMRRFSDHG